jgi:hypothetical protein
VPKKLSIGALSQQFALRLIDWMMAAACRAVVAGSVLTAADAHLIVKQRSGLG